MTGANLGDASHQAALAGLQGASIAQYLARSEGHRLTPDQVVAQTLANRILPPHHAEATQPEEAYR